MENNNENYDFEKHMHEDEGVVIVFFRKVRETISTMLKLKWVKLGVAVIGVILAVVGLMKKDVGEIIEEIYIEAKSDVYQTQKSIALVQLPDSLENTEEVRRIRVLQNNILAYHIALSSQIKNFQNFEKGICFDDDSINKNYLEYLKKCYNTLGSVQALFTRPVAITNEAKIFFLTVSAKNDSTISSSVGVNNMAISHYHQERFKAKLVTVRKVINEININSIKARRFGESKIVKSVVEVLTDLLKSDELRNACEHTRMLHMEYLNATNLRLLNIKNESLKKHK